MTSQARAAEFNAATAARVRYNSDELDDLSLLRSSQPISLGAITASAQSRNKGSKSWKPLAMRDIEKLNGIANLANSQSATRQFDIQFMTSLKYDISNPHPSISPLQPTIASQPSHLQMLESNENKVQWFHELHPHVQKNSLSHTGNIETGRDTLLRLHFLSNGHTGDHYPSRATTTQDSGLVAHGGKPGAEMRRNNFFQNDLHKASVMPDSAIDPCTQSLYSGSELNSQQNIGSLSHVHGQHRQLKDGSSPPEQSNPWPENEDTKYHIYSSEFQTQPDSNLPMTTSNLISAGGKYKGQRFSLLSTQPCVPTEGLNLTKAGLGDGDEQHMQTRLQGLDTKREVTAYLKSVVEASKCNEDMEAFYNPMARMQTLSTKKESEKTSRPNDAQQLYLKPEKSKTKTQQGPFQATSGGVLLEPTSPATELKHDSKSWEKSTTIHSGENVGGNIIRAPPPGLSKRATSSSIEPILPRDSPPVESQRLKESNRWFHTDGRGEDEFRRRFLDIAQTEALKRKPNMQPEVMKENRVVEPITLLLGDVFANLRSYAQSDYFSDFGKVPYYCCEPTHGGRRSYFDRDPSVDQWRFPTGHPYGGSRVSRHQDSP